MYAQNLTLTLMPKKQYSLNNTTFNTSIKSAFILKLKLENNIEMSKYAVDERGYYGNFGGAFIPEMLYPNVEELRENYLLIMEEDGFKEEYDVFPACHNIKSTKFTYYFAFTKPDGL